LFGKLQAGDFPYKFGFLTHFMDFIEYSGKLEDLKYFIKNQSATSVDELAHKLDVSGRTVRRMIVNLRMLGVDIKYSKREKIYFIDS
jgi:biotin operon repressor